MERNISAHPSTPGALVDVDLVVASDNGPVSRGTFPLNMGQLDSVRYGRALYPRVPLPHR